MGDSTIMNSVFSLPAAPWTASAAPVPASVLARWAAIAAERACRATIPRQDEAA